MLELFYSENELGDDGSKYIADVLAVNTTLNSLDTGRELFFLFVFV